MTLIGLLVVGCSARGCGGTSHQVPLVKIYNRTLTTVRFGDGWVPICEKGLIDLAHWPTPWPPPTVTPPPGAVPISFDLGVPSDYKGDVSVIVSESGVEVIRGEPDEGSLPACAGVPPS